MNINIYGTYLVKIKGNYSTLIDRNLDIFETNEINTLLQINGSRLMEEISSELKASYIQEVDIKSNLIRFEYFDYNTGEAKTITYEISEIKKGEENEKDRL